MRKDMMEILACPVCKGPLTLSITKEDGNEVIEGYKRGDREGVYLGIRSDIAHYGQADALPAPHELTIRLAEIPTRLEALEPVTQERLINWGYAICDAGVRQHLDPRARAPAGLPYADSGLGEIQTSGPTG